MLVIGWILDSQYSLDLTKVVHTYYVLSWLLKRFNLHIIKYGETVIDGERLTPHFVITGSLKTAWQSGQNNFEFGGSMNTRIS